MALKYDNLKSLFDAIAQAIREKEGSTETIVADDFPERISAIGAGGAIVQPKSVTVHNNSSGSLFFGTYVDSTNQETIIEIASGVTKSITTLSLGHMRLYSNTGKFFLSGFHYTAYSYEYSSSGVMYYGRFIMLLQDGADLYIEDNN